MNSQVLRVSSFEYASHLLYCADYLFLVAYFCKNTGMDNLHLTTFLQCFCEKGTTIYEGVAAPQTINGGAGNLLGGGNQIFINRKDLDASWFHH